MEILWSHFTGVETEAKQDLESADHTIFFLEDWLPAAIRKARQAQCALETRTPMLQPLSVRSQTRDRWLRCLFKLSKWIWLPGSSCTCYRVLLAGICCPPPWTSPACELSCQTLRGSSLYNPAMSVTCFFCPLGCCTWFSSLPSPYMALGHIHSGFSQISNKLSPPAFIGTVMVFLFISFSPHSVWLCFYLFYF